MNFENYYDDKETILAHPRRVEILQTLVDCVRQLNGNDNFKAYQDMFPFSLECEEDFPARKDQGKDHVNDLLKYVKANRQPKDIATLLAWLWYRHEEKAKLLYDKFELEHHPYRGSPNLDDCPKHIVDSFQPRTDTPNENSDPAPEETLDQDEQIPSSATGIPDLTVDTGAKAEKSVFWRIFASPEFVASFALSGGLVVAAYWVGMIPI